ncbi:SRPBCC family protein [Pollutibacter soli]|uniref:SRPBCC family protein n=1 Tax=Pollutibacter soli TaxID=3034157 RepID=UPI003013ED02
MAIDKNLIITDSVIINAPAYKVWQGLTDPALVKQYFYGTDVQTSWSKNSPIVFRGEWEGKTYEEKGEILDIENNKLISYSYLTTGLQDIPENYAIITYLLNDNHGHTTMRVKQQGFRNEEAMEHSIAGWKQILSGLKSLVESL